MIRRRLAVFLLCSSVLAFHLQSTTHAQFKKDPLLDKMLEALGGQAYLDVKEIQTSGRFFGFTRGELSSSDVFVDFVRLPDMERVELGIGRNKSVTINRGQEGWKLPARKDPELQTPGEVAEFQRGMKTSLDYVLRFALAERQTTVQALPSEIVDFKRTDVVELRDPSKNRIRIYIDRNTRLPVKMQVRLSDESKVREEQYANWHMFQGVMTPLFLSRYTDNVKTMEIRAENVVYNPGLADILFTGPSALK